VPSDKTVSVAPYQWNILHSVLGFEVEGLKYFKVI
jgi:hypothetical protein